MARKQEQLEHFGKLKQISINPKNHQVSTNSKRFWVEVLGAYIEGHKKEAEKLKIKPVQTKSPFRMGHFQVIRQTWTNNNGIQIYDRQWKK